MDRVSQYVIHFLNRASHLRQYLQDNRQNFVPVSDVTEPGQDPVKKVSTQIRSDLLDRVQKFWLQDQKKLRSYDSAGLLSFTQLEQFY